MAENAQTVVQQAAQPLCIVPHLGLGDMIVLNGLIRMACAQRPEVLLFVKRTYISSLRSLFGDLRNLRLKFVEEAHEIHADGQKALRDAEARGYEMLLLGVHSGSRWRELDPLWPAALYRQAGLDPSFTHSAFSVQQNNDRENALLAAVRAAVGEVYVVVHDDASRAMTLDARYLPPGMPVVHVDDPRWRTNNIFDYIAVIDNAMQFHSIDSCFMLMADMLSLKARKFCHAYTRDAGMLQGLYRGDVTIIRERHRDAV